MDDRITDKLKKVNSLEGFKKNMEKYARFCLENWIDHEVFLKGFKAAVSNADDDSFLSLTIELPDGKLQLGKYKFWQVKSFSFAGVLRSEFPHLSEIPEIVDYMESSKFFDKWEALINRTYFYEFNDEFMRLLSDKHGWKVKSKQTFLAYVELELNISNVTIPCGNCEYENLPEDCKVKFNFILALLLIVFTYGFGVVIYYFWWRRKNKSFRCQRCKKKIPHLRDYLQTI
jgi:hypothetical protein